MLLKCRHEGGNGRSFLADGHIDTIDRLACLIETLLVDNRINGDGGLTRLTVTNDQLTLSASDGDHRVDGLQTCLQRLLHGLTVDHTRSLTIERHLECLFQIDVSLAVDSLSQRIDDAAQHVIVDADRGNTLRTLNDHTLFDARGGTEKHTTDVVLFQVHHDSHRAVLKFQQLVCLGVAQSVDTGHTIADSQHSTHFVEFLGVGNTLELVDEDLGDFTWFNLI